VLRQFCFWPGHISKASSSFPFSERLDTSTPAGKLVFTVLGAGAELERSVIVERVMAGLRNAPREGKTNWPSKEESTRSCHPAWLGFDFQGPAEEAVIAVQAPIRADKNSGHQGFKHSFCS